MSDCQSTTRRLFAIICAVAALLIGAGGLRAATIAAPAKLTADFTALAHAHEAQRKILLKDIGQNGSYQLIAALRAYQNGLLAIRDGAVVMFGPVKFDPIKGKRFPVLDALSGKPLVGPKGKPLLVTSLPDDALTAHDRDQSQIHQIIMTLSLSDPNARRRRDAFISLGNHAKAANVVTLANYRKRHPTDPMMRIIRESQARILLKIGTPTQKAHAARVLGNIASARSSGELRRARKLAIKTHDPALAGACATALARIESYNREVSTLFDGFAGLSLASIYVLMALGLAIIFGVMGVINMAQGEFMAVGAFTTFEVCAFFKAHVAHAWFNWYFVCAIPLAFIVSAGVGYIVEATIVRRLYGRPLETLLATWGVSLVLIQLIRVVFGNNNALTAPTWFTGGWKVMHGLTLPLNRLFIIGFCALCVAGMFWIVRRTKLGLLLRATAQDRAMAASLGVRTRVVDGLTFALGSGLAGMAGCAVPLFAKLGPSMGQSYIVDSFMVVVVGGVGNLVGVLVAGLGLGFLEKFIEPFMQPVYAKVIVLVLIILFLQWRPSGIFAAKGRSVDN